MFVQATVFAKQYIESESVHCESIFSILHLSEVSLKILMDTCFNNT